MNDIYAYFDYHGTLKERVSAPVRANSTQVNSIYAYWDNQSVEPVTYSVTWRLVGSDSIETTSEHYAETLAIPANYLGRRDLVFFKEAKLYNFIRFPVPSAVTAVAGTYVATIRYALSTQATFVLGSLTFEVEGDRGIVLGESLTLDQYNYLLEQYSEVYDWATLRFLPLTGGTISGDLEVTGTTTLDYLNVSEIGAGSISSSGTIRTSDKAAAKEYWLSIPDKTIIKLDNSIDGPGYSGELQFGIPSGDYSPAFYGSLGVKMLSGREKVYPAVRFNYYDDNDSYESTTEEQIATQQWSDARYLKLAGGSVTGPVTFNSSATFNSPLTSYGYFTLQSGMTISGLEIHGGNEDHAGNATFTKNITISAAVPTQASHATRKDYVDNLIASVKANAFQVVQALPQSGEEGIIYLVPIQGEDYYTQYIWEGNSWLNIGDTDIDLSGYLPLTGGTITGNLSINGSVYLNGSDLQTELSEKANKDSYYGTLGAGYADVAKELETSIGTEQETPISFNTVGGDSDVSTGEHRLDALTGVSVVDNQLVRNGNFDNSDGWYMQNGSLSVASNVVTFTQTTPAGYSRLTQTLTNDPVSGHILFLAFWIKHDYSETITIQSVYGRELTLSVAPNTWTLFIRVYECNSASKYATISTKELASACNVQVKQVIFRDLTQRYGNNTVVNAIIGDSNQVANLLRFDPNILKLTSYEAGSLVSSKTKELLSVGYNAFDGVLEGGGINNSDGQNNNNTANFRTKYYTRAVGGEKYTFEYNRTALGGYMYVHQYDINKNWIKTNSYIESSAYQLVLEANCYYVRVNWYKSGSGWDANVPADAKVCFHLTWDGSRTGFEPHETHSYQLPNLVQRGILKVDGSGNIYADGDVAYPDGTGETRSVLIHLGDLPWSYNSSEAIFQVYKGDIQGNTQTTATEIVGVCTKYPCSTNGRFYWPNEEDKTFTISSDKYIRIKDSAYTSAADFKTAMAGVYLVAKLATPTPITFEPFTPNIYGDDFGTFQALDEDGNEANLQGFNIFYRANIAGYAESLYANTKGKPAKVVLSGYTEIDPQIHYLKDTDDRVSAIKEALGGTLRQVLAVKASIDFGNTNYVDLGDLDWVYYSSEAYFSNAIISDVKTDTNNAVCTLYKTNTSASYAAVLGNMEFKIFGNVLHVKNTAYTDATAFKAAMKGVLLAYEKAS